MGRRNLSARERARFLARQPRLRPGAALAPTAARPSWRRRLAGRWRQQQPTLRDWVLSLPEVLFGELFFSGAFWIALLVVAAATLFGPAPLIPTQLGVVAVILVTLFTYHKAARRRVPAVVGKVSLTVVDAMAAITIFALTLPMGTRAQGLLLFAAATMAARFRHPLMLAGGVLLSIPFTLLRHEGFAGACVEAFTVVALMGALQFILFMADRARLAAALNANLLGVASVLARAHNERTIHEALIRLVLPVSPSATWILWQWDGELEAFRPVRSYGVPACCEPLAIWRLGEIADGQAVDLEGVLPFKEWTGPSGDTLIQPMRAEGQLLGLISMTGCRSEWTPGARAVLRGIADEAAVALGRACLLEEERARALELEVVNAIAGQVALSGSPLEALEAVRPHLARLVAFDSVYLSVFAPNGLALVAGPGDPLSRHLPEETPLEGSRTAEVCARGGAINELVSEVTWRTEDAWWCAAGITSVLAVPLALPGAVLGTLQFGRREAAAFTAREQHLIEAVAAHLAAHVARGWFPADGSQAPAQLALATP